MELLENEKLQQIVDYSFGDHSGVLGGVPNAYMKKASIHNDEFRKVLMDFEHPVMTLFIDNIRLYRRSLDHSDWMHQKPISAQDRAWLSQFDDEDLLELCRICSWKKFIIFTAFEDTPLDEYVWEKIPDNVLAIYAANAVLFGGKVHPFPHGIERKMHAGYNHHELLKDAIQTTTEPHKLLFVAHRTDTGDRKGIGAVFEGKPWATVTHLPYEKYLQGIQNHKFVLCPSGNGIESARNWETLYLHRVPVFKRHPYLEEMFKDFPALFIDEWEDVTEELLLANDRLYQEAQSMDMSKLDLKTWYNKYTNI